MPKKMEPLHTVVQHSAYGYGEDTTFERGLESRTVRTVAEKKLVEKVGGVLFDDYLDAEQFAEKAQYPDTDGFSIIPQVRGTFSEHKIDGLRIYVPIREIVG